MAIKGFLVRWGFWVAWACAVTYWVWVNFGAML